MAWKSRNKPTPERIKKHITAIAGLAVWVIFWIVFGFWIKEMGLRAPALDANPFFGAWFYIGIPILATIVVFLSLIGVLEPKKYEQKKSWQGRYKQEKQHEQEEQGEYKEQHKQNSEQEERRRRNDFWESEQQHARKKYYDCLGLTPDATTVDEVNKAYREMIKKFHPDHNKGSTVATEMTKKINEARNFIIDELTKA